MAYGDFKSPRVDMYARRTGRDTRLWVWQFGSWMPVGGGDTPSDREWWKQKGLCTRYIHGRPVPEKPIASVPSVMELPVKPKAELSDSVLWGDK